MRRVLEINYQLIPLVLISYAIAFGIFCYEKDKTIIDMLYFSEENKIPMMISTIIANISVFLFLKYIHIIYKEIKTIFDFLDMTNELKNLNLELDKFAIEANVTKLLMILADLRIKKNYEAIDAFFTSEKTKKLDLIYLISTVNFLFNQKFLLKEYMTFLDYTIERAKLEDTVEYERLMKKF